MRPPLAPQLLLYRPVATDRPRGQADPAHRRLVGHRRGRRRAVRRRGATVVAVARRQDLLDALADRITAGGRRRAGIRVRPLRPGRRRRAGRRRRDAPWRGGHPDQQRRPVHPPAAGRVAGSLARRRADHGAQLLLAAAADPRPRARDARARRRAHHQRLDLGRAQRSSPLFAVYNASKAALSAVSRVDRNRMGRQGRALDDAVLPAGGHPDDRPDQGVRRAAGADLRGGRRLDGHRRPHPAGPDRTADGDRGQALDTIGPAGSTRS